MLEVLQEMGVSGLQCAPIEDFHGVSQILQDFTVFAYYGFERSKVTSCFQLCSFQCLLDAPQR